MGTPENQLEWIGLLLLLGSLFILETESIISLLYFVSLLLILIFNLLPIYFSNFSYFSYMIIIVYLSALVILFSYVIFLSNTDTFSTNTFESNNELQQKFSNYSTGVFVLPLFLLSVVIISNWLTIPSTIEIPLLSNNLSFIFKPDILDSIGILLYEHNRILIQFLLITILLFITLIGIIILLSSPLEEKNDN